MPPGEPRKSKFRCASREASRGHEPVARLGRALRTQDLLSEGAVRIVARALEAHREDIERGALLSIDEGGTRVRMLPLKGSQGPS